MVGLQSRSNVRFSSTRQGSRKDCTPTPNLDFVLPTPGIRCGVDLVDRNPRDVVEPSAGKLIPKPNQKELDTPRYYQFYGTQP